MSDVQCQTRCYSFELETYAYSGFWLVNGEASCGAQGRRAASEATSDG